MGFLKRLSGIFKAPAQASDEKFYLLTVRCNRCGEILHGQVNVYNELSADEDEAGQPVFQGRKVLIGSGRCFQQIEVSLRFNARRELIHRQITGGTFVEGPASAPTEPS
jgi:hypothetical protein